MYHTTHRLFYQLHSPSTLSATSKRLWVRVIGGSMINSLHVLIISFPFMELYLHLTMTM